MKNKLLFLIIILITQFGFAQLSLPHLNTFNSTTSDEGWTHYAISGTDNWERGNASVNPIITELSWNTALNGSPTASSMMVLESPAFDLTDAALPYVLSFKYQAAINQGNLYLEYTIDNGTTWTLLNPDGALKRSWQSTNGFFLGSSSTSVIRNPAIDISSLAGNVNVKFRFRFKTYNYVNGYGCILDDFAIKPEYYNIYASIGEPVEISPLCPEIVVKTSLNFDNQYTQSYPLETNYYLSTDTTLDASDMFLGTQSVNVSSSDSTYDYVVPTPENLNPGQYYIVYKHDYTNVLEEDNEDDNASYISLLVKPIFNLPYQTDFETEDINWKSNTGSIPDISIWERGEGIRHHIEGAHSGTNAWHTSNTVMEHPDYLFQTVESPYFNLNSSSEPLILSFWYKDDYPGGVGYYDNEYKVQYQLNCNSYWQELYVFPENLSDDWEYLNIPLDETISTNENVRFRITYRGTYLGPEGIIFDDFYLGEEKPDLSIESIFSNDRFTSANSTTDMLKYQFRNSGSDVSQNVNTNFYWSDDNQLDANDVLLGSKSITGIVGNNDGQWLEFNYTKPTLATGDYFIIYQIDSDNDIDETRENNNIGAIAIKQNTKYGFPYFNDFETQADSWYHNSTLGVDEWELSTAQGVVLNETFSGDKAFISKPTGSVTSMSRMHLYTPPFDLSSSINPVIEFDMKLDNFMLCSCFEITLNFSYSVDNGATWTVLNPVNDSFSKWNDVLKYSEYSGLDEFLGNPRTEKMFAKGETAITNFTAYNSRDIDRNTKYIISIPQLKDETNIRFRFNLSTENNDETSPNVSNSGQVEGALIDNFQIKEAEVDLGVPYTKNLYVSESSNSINFSIDVKNTGNYISDVSNIKFYLSQDNTYNAGDYLIGEEMLTAIQPDRKLHKILEYNLPSTFSNYSYLVYVIDDVNANIEINEANNTGAFTLGLEGITSFPYVEDFENDIIDGWYGYAYKDIDDATLTNYRVTNKLPITYKENEARRLINGMLRTEYVPYGSWQDYLTPLFYIQSPVFDFTSSDTSEPLFMAFDLMSVGKSTRNGSNMEYSLDGGNSWTLLTINSSPTTSNWYPNWQTMSDMYNQPGWRDDNGDVFRVEMDISFLQSQSNVTFRYKYFSNYATSSSAPRGFRLDNFTIARESEINDFGCLEDIPYVMNFNNYEAPCWTIDGVLSKDANATIQWEIVDNFAATTDEFSAKIDIVGDNDADGSWLISPLFNIEGDVMVSFNIGLTQLGNNNTTDLDNDDEVKLMYSTDDGETWLALRIWDNTTPISSTGELIQEVLSNTGYTRIGFWASNGIINDLGESSFYVSAFNIEDNILSVDEFETIDFRYFPNPVTNDLTIQSKLLNSYKLEIYNVSGQLLYGIKPNAYEHILSFENYASGIYFIKAMSESKSTVFKVVKK